MIANIPILIWVHWSHVSRTNSPFRTCISVLSLLFCFQHCTFFFFFKIGIRKSLQKHFVSKAFSSLFWVSIFIRCPFFFFPIFFLKGYAKVFRNILFQRHFILFSGTAFLFCVCSTPILPQWHAKDPAQKWRWQVTAIYAYIFDPKSRSGLIIPSSHSVGTHQGNELIRNSVRERPSTIVLAP